MYVIHQIIGIIILFKYFDKKVKMNVMDYFYLIIQTLRGIITKVVVEIVFANPQEEKTSG